MSNTIKIEWEKTPTEQLVELQLFLDAKGLTAPIEVIASFSHPFMVYELTEKK